MSNPNLQESHTNYVIKNLNPDVNQQLQILENNKSKYPENYTPPYNKMYQSMPGLIGSRDVHANPKESERFDPLGDFMYKKGLLDRDNTTRYIRSYLNIDSKYRNKTDSSIIPEWILLDSNPLSFNTLDTRLFISHPNHPYETGDKISITGIQQQSKKLKIKVNNINIIDFTNNSLYMTIRTSSGFTFSNIGDAQAFDTSDLYVSISGVLGFPGKSYIENIPVNTINGIHRIYIVHPELGTYDPNIFYIKLITAFSGSYAPDDYNFSLTYYYIGGIPLNVINAEYPIDVNNLQGYHLIQETLNTGYYIDLPKAPGANLTGFGGNNINVGKIEELILGYPEPNTYIQKLNKVYDNIILVRMISSEFPNAEQVVKNISGKQNNKLYWQNLDDGDTVYNIEIDPGNYKPDELKTILETKFYATLRTSTADLGGILSSSTYTQNNYITVDINTKTDIVKFSSYKESLLIKPFTEVSPAIATSGGTQAESYTLTLTHNNHGLSVGDSILIKGAIAYLGIPTDVLNTTHVVTEVIDGNRYKIVVSHFNLGTDRQDTGGGNAVKIYVPNLFRMLFNYTDTLGSVLGFRNSGDSNSITSYGSVVSNNDPYYLEQLQINAGKTPSYSLNNNAIILSGDNYILMVCKQIQTFIDYGSVKNVFCKILLSDLPGKVLFNSFVDTPVFYHNMLSGISELEFEFYSPDGILYDFNGLDHSFMLEFTTVHEIPKGSGISSKIGQVA